MPAPKGISAARPITLPNLLSLAVLNLRRHGLRAIVNVVGIAITVAALVFFLAFYRGTYEGVMFSSVIDYATSHGQLMSSGFDDEDPDSWLEKANLIDEEKALGAWLQATGTGGTQKAEAKVAPRLMAPAFAGNGSRKASVILAGVDFDREPGVLSIDRRMAEGGFGGEGVVVGKKLAEALGLAAGDEIRIQANAADGAPNLDYWRIAGIFSTGYPPLDRGLVMMALPQAQSFLAAGGKVNKLYCRLARQGDSMSRERAIAAFGGGAAGAGLEDAGLRFRDWKSYAKPIVEDARADGGAYAVFLGILLFLSLATMAGTMRVTVFERRREIGMLRASGWLRREIRDLFLLEAIAIGAIGSVSGCVIGGLASVALELRPIGFGGAMAGLDIPDFSLTCDLQAVDFLWSILAGFLTSLAAGIAPAQAAARMPILSALSER